MIIIQKIVRMTSSGPWLLAGPERGSGSKINDYEYAYICIYIEREIYIPTCMHACTHACMHTYIHIHIYIYIYVHIDAYVYIYIYTHSYAYIYIEIDIYIYI